MGEIKKEHKKAILIIGLLVSSEKYFDVVEHRLEYDFGDIARRSETIPFVYTDFYNKEMGDNILRRWISFKDLIFEDELSSVKHHTNNLELLYKPDDSSGRQVNIDPGIITLDKLILASTKNYSHRILINDGIYVEITLNYKKQKGFAPCDWTYPDYHDPQNLEFFNQVRGDLKKMIHS